MKKLLCLISVIAIALFLFCSDALAVDNTIVIGDLVNLRYSPEIKDNNVISKLYYGENLYIIDSFQNWYLVQTGQYVGYIHADYVGIETVGTVAITSASVNFRSQPNTSSKVYKVIPKHAAVKVLDAYSEWYLVEYNGKRGYVFSDYLTTKYYEGELLIGTFTTQFSTGSSQSGRIKNIEKSAGMINEYIIASGEEFSLLDAIGPINKAGGYYQAPEYQRTPEGTKTVTGYGGGVCQLATTLYQSVCNAQDSGSKLTVTERHQHSKSVYYIADGKDATISWNAGQDFSFINSNSYSICIRTFVSNGNVSCMIYKIMP